jgi:large subunit ribosomal protein L14e
MVSMEIGRVCMKISGREAGKYCVVLKKEGNAFVLVTGPKILTGVKRRRANIEHLEPTKYIVEIPENASDELVLDGFGKAGLLTKLGLKKPSAGEMKYEKSKVPKEEKRKREEEKPKKEEKIKEERKKTKINKIK